MVIVQQNEKKTHKYKSDQKDNKGNKVTGIISLESCYPTESAKLRA